MKIFIHHIVKTVHQIEMEQEIKCLNSFQCKNKPLKWKYEW